MRTDWMQNAHEHNSTDQQKAAIRRAISALEWERAPRKDETITLPIMPGLGIQNAIESYRIPKVSHFAISHDLAPYGFYGIRGHYKGLDHVDVFIIDEGSALLAVCADVYELQEASCVK